jgi:hypothetical protein
MRKGIASDDVSFLRRDTIEGKLTATQRGGQSG